MINSVKNKIWTNNKNQLFAVVDFYDRQRGRWAKKVQIIENEETGRHYWIEDSRDEDGPIDATNFIKFQMRMYGACEIDERSPSEAIDLSDRFFKAQQQIIRGNLFA